VVTPGELDRLLASASVGGGTRPLAQLIHQLRGSPTDELERAAAGPLAHLACRSLVHQLSDEGELDPWVAAILGGLVKQSNMLAVLDATDELLISPAFVRAYGARLHRAFLHGHRIALDATPLVASAFAEGALRLAIGGVGNILTTLAILTPDEVNDLKVEYAERLPRLIGAALDAWGRDESAGQALRATLSALTEVPECTAYAVFEGGLDLLRQAASGRSADAPRTLVAARRQFANAVAADEACHDAALYGAGVDAVMAFFRGDEDQLRTAHASLRGQLDQRTAWLRRSHLPAWRRPRVEAAFAWARLVVILDRAQQATAEPVWLDAWCALDAVLDAYTLDRTVVPVPGVIDAQGFSQLVQPVIESTLSRRQMLLAQLDRALAEEAVRATKPLAWIDQLRQLKDRLPGSMHQADNDDVDIRLRERLVGNAPTVLAELGIAGAATVASQLDDEGLRLMEGVAYNAMVHRASVRDPVIARLLEQLTNDLQLCADYTGAVRHAFDALVEETVTFVAARHDLQRSSAVDYLQPASPAPREVRLQDDFADWLRRGQLGGRIDVEVPNVATGRADIKVGFGATRFFIEVKRELRDCSNQALERSYVAQAADYAGTSARLGALLVLDLSPHETGVRHLSECIWVTRYRPANSSVDRYVVVAVVIGNRGSPSSYSRNAK